MQTDRKTRSSSIELLRIIAILGVIVLHYNNVKIGGGFLYVPEGSGSQAFLYAGESLFIAGVDVFVLISAYFLAGTQKRSLSKIAELVIQLILFRVLFFCVDLAAGAEFSKRALVFALLPVDYFIILYSLLYIGSPWLNLLLDRLNPKQLKKLVLGCFLLFSVWNIGVDLLKEFQVFGDDVEELSTIGLYGTENGYTIVNFVLLYLIGAWLRRCNIRLSRKQSLLMLLVCFAAIYALSFAARSAWHYENPFVIGMAVAALLFFKELQFQSTLVNELAAAAFTCYLFHEGVLKYAHVQQAATAGLPILAAHLTAVCVGLYLASYVVYKIYHPFSKWLMAKLSPRLNKIDLWSLEEK